LLLLVTILGDKIEACNMLSVYASELKEGFFPYVDQVAKIMVPLLRFFYHHDVRAAAVTTMPSLLTCASEYMKKAGPGADMTYLQNMLHYIFTTMVEAIQQETETDLLVWMLEAIAEILL